MEMETGKIELDITKMKEVERTEVEIESPWDEEGRHVFKITLYGVDSKNANHKEFIKNIKDKARRKEGDKEEYRIILNNTLVTGYGFADYIRAFDGDSYRSRLIIRFETDDFIYQNGPQVNRNLRLDSILETLED